MGVGRRKGECEDLNSMCGGVGVCVIDERGKNQYV